MGRITWKRYLARQELVLPSIGRVQIVREPGGQGEGNLKPGLFKVIELQTTEGDLELAVPTADVDLVQSAIGSTTD
jgi:hypothetical protein